MVNKEDPQGNSELQTIMVCRGTGCVSGGSNDIYETLKREVEAAGLKNVKVDFTGCHGFCQRGPIAVIEPEGYFYTEVTTDDVPEIVQSHLVKGQPVERLFYRDPETDKPIPFHHDVAFYARQQRIILRNCGQINPERIEEYLNVGGYKGLRKVLLDMTPEQVIAEIKKSGLRGRGGGGFSTGTKWEFCRRSPGTEKYVICNADEGDPGAFMDRSILEADPHAVLEGMVIAGYAMGSNHGYVYCRAEYPLAIERLFIALAQMKENNFLGDNILDSGFNFEIEVKEGAGAFVCGEETALMASIEGKRGMPRPRPPFPAQAGLWGKPTNINNVKSYASVPIIMDRGADWYTSIGTETSHGTAVFALTGKTRNSGLIEVPMGITLGEVIFDIGEGIIGDKRFKAVQTGGPSGGCLPSSMLGLQVDYESLAKVGSIMGSGGMVVVDEDTCMVDLARFFLSFTEAESCGKCVPCRVGTKQMLGILERICGGEGKPGDIELLEKLSQRVKATALCGLGQTAPNPILSTIAHFRHEYEEHIHKHYCRAGVCNALVTAPCTNACPAGINVPRYVRLINDGKYGEAVAVIREKVPFPAVLGYVCVHYCEAKCRRGQLEEAIAIKELKRFAADHDTGMWKQSINISPPTGKKVAIVGSGPAGLTAAYYLNKQGHKVTVFESLPITGGMMRVGIPRYRLPDEVLDGEIKAIEDLGVEIKVNSKVESLDDLFKQGYDAIFIGIGSHKGINMGMDGEDTPGVVDGADFLREISLGREVKIGEKVAVIGGGNVAIDAARSALRLGAKDVSIIYRRTRAEMPAAPEEIEEALEEGIQIEFLAAPSKASRSNGRLSAEFIRMKLGAVDTSGRKRPEPMEGSEFEDKYDLLIKAIGQETELPSGFELEAKRGGRIETDPDTLATSREGVFAGGDAVTGPASVIEAIAHGRLAAISIDRYLGGEGNIDEILAPQEEVAPFDISEIEGEKFRPALEIVPAEEGISISKQVVIGFKEGNAIDECQRCLRCDLEEH
ncbi:NADH-quinone oxidoreductase subunit NuoF [Bacteroidota bacterium]